MTRTKSSTLLLYLFLLFNIKICHVFGTESENTKNISTTNIILNPNPDERNHNETREKIKEAQDQMKQENVEPLKLKEETITTKQNKTLLQKFNPKEITFHIIFQFLNPFDICQVTKVCKSFYQCYVASAAEEKEILKEKRKNLNENEEKKSYKHNDFCHYSFFDKKIFKFREKIYTEYVINEKTYTKNSGILPKSIFQMFFTQHSYKRLIPLKRGPIYLFIDDPVRYILYKNKCLSVRFDNKEKFSRADNSIFRLRLDPPLAVNIQQLTPSGAITPAVGIMYENGGEEHMRLAEYGTPALDDFSICQCPHEIKTILLDDFMTYLKLSEREGKLMLLRIFKNEEDLYVINEILQKFNIRQFKGQNLSNLKDIIFVTPLGDKKIGEL